MIGWFYLVVAILLEVTGTTFMKLSSGFTRLAPSCLMVAFYILSFSALTLAVKRIEISTAYAIWSGVGTALIAVIGIMIFKETLTPVKILSILLIIVGVVGLKATAS